MECFKIISLVAVLTTVPRFYCGENLNSLYKEALDLKQKVLREFNTTFASSENDMMANIKTLKNTTGDNHLRQVMYCNMLTLSEFADVIKNDYLPFYTGIDSIEKIRVTFFKFILSFPALTAEVTNGILQKFPLVEQHNELMVILSIFCNALSGYMKQVQQVIEINKANIVSTGLKEDNISEEKVRKILREHPEFANKWVTNMENLIKNNPFKEIIVVKQALEVLK